MSLIDKIVAYYKCDENTGTTFNDSVGPSTGTYNNTGTAWATGIINSGGNFVNANSNFVNIPAFNNIITYSALSIQAWVKFNSFPSDSRIVANSHTDLDAKGFQLYARNSGGTLFPTFGIGATSNAQAIGSNGLSTGIFYHIVGTYDGAIIRIYVNGIQVGSVANTGAIIASANDIWLSGNPAYSGDYLDGIIDEVGIWQRALTSYEVLKLYANGIGMQFPFLLPSFRSNKLRPHAFSPGIAR